MRKLLLCLICLNFALHLSANAGSKATAIVTGITCSSCADSITKMLKEWPEVLDVTVNVKTGKTVITAKEGQTLSDKKIREALDGEGYKVKSIKME